MKKMIFAAVAASMIASPVLAAAPQRGDHGRPHQAQKAPVRAPAYKAPVHKAPVYKAPVKAPAYKAPQKFQQQHRWNKGQRFDARKAPNYRKIDYRKYRGMKAPPRGYHYVQSWSASPPASSRQS
jgi:Ni/Co efflux regulator RcnB